MSRFCFWLANHSFWAFFGGILWTYTFPWQIWSLFADTTRAHLSVAPCALMKSQSSLSCELGTTLISLRNFELGFHPKVSQWNDQLNPYESIKVPWRFPGGSLEVPWRFLGLTLKCSRLFPQEMMWGLLSRLVETNATGACDADQLLKATWHARWWRWW